MRATDRFRLAVAALGFLHGCTTLPPDASVASIEAEIPAGSGVVIAETLNNSNRITGYVDSWNEIILWRENYEGEDDTYSISALEHSLSTQVYMGVIPAGTYRIGLLYTARRIGDTTYFARALVPPAVGTFDVRPGQLTNLGTMMYHPFQARHRTEESYPDFAVTRLANSDLLQYAGVLYPRVMAQIDSALPVLGWLDDAHAGVRNATANLIKEAAFPTDMRMLRDGRYLLTGVNGALYSLDEGHWRNRSLAHHYKITGMVELPSGELLIGSEFGKLAIGRPNGDFEYISMGHEPRHVIDVVLSDAGGAYVVSDVMESYEVHRFQSDRRSISLLKNFPKLTEGFLQVELSHPASLGTANGIAVYIDKEVHRYDEASGSWSADEAVEFYALHEQPNGSVTGIPYSAWSGARPLHYSDDGGWTFSAITEEGGLLSGPVYRPSYRFADGEFIRPGRDEYFHWLRLEYETSDSAPVLSTVDDGASWASVGAVPPGCLDLAVEASHDDRVHILCENGRVIVSDDRGRNWREAEGIREVPDFADFPVGLKVRFNRDNEMGVQKSVDYVTPLLLQ